MTGSQYAAQEMRRRRLQTSKATIVAEHYCLGGQNGTLGLFKVRLSCWRPVQESNPCLRREREAICRNSKETCGKDTTVRWSKELHGLVIGPLMDSRQGSVHSRPTHFSSHSHIRTVRQHDLRDGVDKVGLSGCGRWWPGARRSHRLSARLLGSPGRSGCRKVERREAI